MILNIIGAGGSGKTTLKKALHKECGFHTLVPITTREKRTGEIDGQDYHFVTLTEFLNDDGVILKRDIGMGRMYGNRKNEVVGHKSVTVMTLDIYGVEELIQMGIQVKVIYLNVSEEERRSRMLKRGDTLCQVEERILIDKRYFDNLQIGVPFLEISEGSVDDIIKKISSFLGM